jgi:hypothetical protein
MRANRRDDNEAAIVEYWREQGCLWIPQGREAGFDGVLIIPDGRICLVEIKNCRQYWKMTDAELGRRGELLIRGVILHIITNLEDAKVLLSN